MKVIDQSVRILNPICKQDAIEGMRLIEYAGRNCYRSHDKMTEESYNGFIKNLRRRGHTSPLEFYDVTVELVTSRDVMSEITRHRMASFAIQSQRYVCETKDDDVHFIRPVFYTENPNDEGYRMSIAWRYSMQEAEDAYKRMLNAGAKNQDARKVLPNSTATVIVMKANLREWLHILALRDSKAAYPEMRQLAHMIREEFNMIFPDIFEEENDGNDDGSNPKS